MEFLPHLLLAGTVSSFLRGPLRCPSGLKLQFPEFPEGNFHRGSMIAQEDTQEIYKAESVYTRKRTNR